MYILPPPSHSLSDVPTPAHIEARQATTTVTTSPQQNVVGGCGGQYSGGTLAGAIIGTFFGTLLILYLWQAINNPRRNRPTEVIVERKTRRHRSRSGGSSHGSVRRPSRVYSTRS